MVDRFGSYGRDINRWKNNRSKYRKYAETPGLGSKASEPNFKGQFSEKEAKELSVVKGSATSDNQIAAISGATITSEAVTTGVNAAMKIYNEISWNE